MMKIKKRYCPPGIKVKVIVPSRILGGSVTAEGPDMPWGAKQSSYFFEGLPDNEDDSNNASEYIIDFNYE